MSKKDIDEKKLEIGRRIAQARKDKGMTQGDVAEALGITTGAVGQWERGFTEPTMETMLNRLPAVLGRTKEWIMNGEEPDDTNTANDLIEEEMLRLNRRMTTRQRVHILERMANMIGEEIENGDHRRKAG